MSFIITVHTYEGIIMASDSRSTGSIIKMNIDGSIQHALGSQITDTTYKTFLFNSRIGISTCGEGAINNIPITGYIERFIVEKSNDKGITVESVAEELRRYFTELSPNSQIHFIVAGYNSDNLSPIVKQVKTENISLGQESIININTLTPGAIWDGEFTTLSKLITPVYVKTNNNYELLPNNGINWNYFTLQDAIDFANYAVDVTIKTMAFENCVKTVGGPIDILVIKPDNSFWIARKELHA